MEDVLEGGKRVLGGGYQRWPFGLRTCLRGSLEGVSKGVWLFLLARAHFSGLECLCGGATLVFARVSRRGEDVLMPLELLSKSRKR